MDVFLEMKARIPQMPTDILPTVKTSDPKK